MKILFFDVELAPNLATVWGIFNQDIGINQLLETSRVMCFSAKWSESKEIIFESEVNGHERMIKKLHKLLSEADAVCHYNGDNFDIPVMNREFLMYGMPPPDSYASIDLLKTVRKKFRFVSNKLDHVSQELGLGKKVSHEGHELWLKCMEKDKVAWEKMKKYNIQDVKLLEKLYLRLLPWIKNHPNFGLYMDTDRPVCTNCGSHKVKKNGIETTPTQQYQRYRCTSCHTPLRGRATILPREKTVNILTQSKL